MNGSLTERHQKLSEGGAKMIMNETQKLKIGNSKSGTNRVLGGVVSQFDYVRAENLDRLGIPLKIQVLLSTSVVELLRDNSWH